MRMAARARMSTSRTANHANWIKSLGIATSSQVSGTVLTITVPTGGIAAGQTLIIRSATDYMSNGPTITDTRGNTYTSLRSAAGGTAMRASIHASTLGTALQAGDVITVTTATAAANRAAAVDQFAGLVEPLTVDVANGATGTTAAPDANCVSTNPRDLVVSLVASVASLTDPFTDDATWSLLGRAGTTGTAPCISLSGGIKSPTSTGTWHYKPTLSTAAQWVALSVALKAT